VSATPADVLWLAEIILGVRGVALGGIWLIPGLAALTLPALAQESSARIWKRWSQRGVAVWALCLFLFVMLPSHDVALAVLEARR
jgi:hypothetical protein